MNTIVDDGATKFANSLSSLKKKVKKAKPSTSKTKVVKPKTKIAKPKIPKTPIRVSPFEKDADVWYSRNHVWIRAKITACCKPDKGKKEWNYSVETGNKYDLVVESDLLPAQIFTMMTTDVVKMIRAPFTDVLNEVFDAKANIFAVYRAGHKRPWAYYVIPDIELIMKKVTWDIKNDYGDPYADEALLYVRPVKNIGLRLTPISSAPQEILTYLGLHIYNRVWMKGMLPEIINTHKLLGGNGAQEIDAADSDLSTD